MNDPSNQQSMQRDASPSIRILRKLHTRLETLLDYLHLIADPASRAHFESLSKASGPDGPAKEGLERYLLHDDDPVVYRELVTKALVAETGPINETKRLPLGCAECSMPEVSSWTKILLRFFLILLYRSLTERMSDFSLAITDHPMS